MSAERQLVLASERMLPLTEVTDPIQPINNESRLIEWPAITDPSRLICWKSSHPRRAVRNRRRLRERRQRKRREMREPKADGAPASDDEYDWDETETVATYAGDDDYYESDEDEPEEVVFTAAAAAIANAEARRRAAVYAAAIARTRKRAEAAAAVRRRNEAARDRVADSLAAFEFYEMEAAEALSKAEQLSK